MNNTTSVELKYCERCGGLWLRDSGSAKVYCVRCVPILDEWPSSTQRKRVRLPVGSPTELVDYDLEIHDFEKNDFGERDLDDIDIDDVTDIDGMACPAPGGVA